MAIAERDMMKRIMAMIRNLDLWLAMIKRVKFILKVI